MISILMGFGNAKWLDAGLTQRHQHDDGDRKKSDSYPADDGADLIHGVASRRFHP
jgi:hypothetical protein